MKNLFWIIISICSATAARGQTNTTAPLIHYVVVDNQQYNTHHIITRRSGADYIEINSTSVEIFNILSPNNLIKPIRMSHKVSSERKIDTILVSISLLPHAGKEINWIPIQLDSIAKGELLPVSDLVNMAERQLIAFQKNGNPLAKGTLCRGDIVPVVNRNGLYYRPIAYALTEFFLISPNTIHTYKQANMATIDIKSPVFPISTLLENASRASHNPHAQAWAAIMAGNLLQSKAHGRYEFWSNPAPSSHATPLHYGTGSFLYQPGVGLVSGKYESYFSESGQFIDDFFDIISIDGKLVKYK
jgi:hypothetical protein